MIGLVGCHHNRLFRLGDREYFFIPDPGLHLRDLRDIMALGSKGVDDRPFDPLVAHELQAGYVGIG